LVEGYSRPSVGGGGGRAFSVTGTLKGVTPVVAQVLRLFRRRVWNTLRATSEMKMSPKMTEAATIIPTTTPGSPLLVELFTFAWLGSVFAWSADEVDVTVVNRGLGSGCGVGVAVTTITVGVL